MTMVSNVEKLEKLEAKFTSADVEWRVGATTKDKSKGMALPYITNRAIQQRLDQVVGKGFWKNEYLPWHNGSQLCKISIRVVFEDGSYEWIDKVDGAECSDFEAIKGGLSDSMKRAAVQWGIGRYLYELPSIWIELKDGKFIPDHEMTRLNAYIDGDQSAVYKNWHDKKGSSSGNTGTGNSTGAGYNKQTTPNTQNTQSSEGQAKVGSTQTGAKGNSSTGNATNFASPGQINYVKSLIKKTNQDEAALLKEYNAEFVDKLTISQANVIIKKLSAIVA